MIKQPIMILSADRAKIETVYERALRRPPGKVRLGLVRFLRKNPRHAEEDPQVVDLGEFEVRVGKPTKLQLKLAKSAFDR